MRVRLVLGLVDMLESSFAGSTAYDVSTKPWELQGVQKRLWCPEKTLRSYHLSALDGGEASTYVHCTCVWIPCVVRSDRGRRTAGLRHKSFSLVSDQIHSEILS